MKKLYFNQIPFGKINYILLITGVLLIALGYLCMLLDKEPYGFGILGLTIAPIMLVSGFVIEIFAIMYRSSARK
jgi:membrane-bound ClpP family serine protease